MTATDKVARRYLSLLGLAYDLDNISKACRVMGYSRQQLCEIRRNFQTYGSQGLVDRLPRTSCLSSFHAASLLESSSPSS